MTIPMGVLVLITAFLAYKMRGAQLPHVLLGMMLMGAAAQGSIVDTIGVQALDLYTQLLRAFFTAIGQGNLV
jgi:hypothetical protein